MVKTTTRKTNEEVNKIIQEAKLAKLKGVSYIQFCLNNDLNYETFKNWLYRRTKQSESQIPGFSMVQKHTAQPAGTIVIEFKNARILAANPEQLRIILSAIG